MRLAGGLQLQGNEHRQLTKQLDAAFLVQAGCSACAHLSHLFTLGRNQLAMCLQMAVHTLHCVYLIGTSCPPTTSSARCAAGALGDAGFVKPAGNLLRGCHGLTAVPAILACPSWLVPPPEPRCACLRPLLPAQAELPFADVDPSQSGPGEPRWLPLYGWKGSGKTAKKVDAGEICVQAWFEAGGRERPGEDMAGCGLGGGSCGAANHACCQRGLPQAVTANCPLARSQMQAAPRSARCASSLARASMCRWWCTAARAACTR